MYRASHILISYQGAQRATSQRIQEEALFEAGRVQQEILSGGISFEEAAQKYSDCPSGKANSGNLGVFERKTMDQDFISFLENLAVGEISGPCPTVYGYHLIRKN